VIVGLDRLMCILIVSGVH